MTDRFVDRLRESVFFHRFAKWCFVVAALVLIVMFSGCTPGETSPPATTGPTPTTTAPTTTTGRCEEDQPSCWDCSPADNACGKRL